MPNNPSPPRRGPQTRRPQTRGGEQPPTESIAEKRRASDGAPAGLLWDHGKRAETAGNRGQGDTSSPSGREFPGGSRGQRSGANQAQMEAVSGTPESSGERAGHVRSGRSAK